MNQVKVISKKELEDKSYDPSALNQINNGTLALLQLYKEPVTDLKTYCRFVAEVLSMDRNTEMIYTYIATKCYNSKYDCLEFDAYKYQKNLTSQKLIPPSLSTIYSSLKFLFYIRALWPMSQQKMYWTNSIYFTPTHQFPVKLLYAVAHK